MDRMGHIMWSQRGGGMRFFTHTCHQWCRLTPMQEKGGRAIICTGKRKFSTLWQFTRVVLCRMEKKETGHFRATRAEPVGLYALSLRSLGRPWEQPWLVCWKSSFWKKETFAYQCNGTRSNRRQDKKQEGNKQKQSPKTCWEPRSAKLGVSQIKWTDLHHWMLRLFINAVFSVLSSL